MKNQRLALDNSDIPPPQLPQCLELVGEEDLLQAFLKRNASHLLRVRVMWLRGEEAKMEAAIDKEELEEALDIERSEHLLD